MFSGKNIFFEKSHYGYDENDRAEQTQQEYTDPDAAGEQLIYKKILRNNEQKQDQYEQCQFFHKQKERLR